jgi:ferredoxin
MTATSAEDDKVHVRVDESLCQGHGRCYDLFPDLFEADDYSAVSRPINDVVPAGVARKAAINCPESAIILAPSNHD